MNIRNARLSTTVAAMIVLASAFATSAQADGNLLVNGDFTVPPCSGHTCTGWTFTPAAAGQNFTWNTGAGIVYFPTWAGFGATAGLDDQISQTIATTAGSAYEVSFQLVSGYSPRLSDFSAQFGSETLLSLVDREVPSSVTTYSFEVEATGASTALTFAGANNQGFTFLSNVDVTALPSPGPTPGAGLLGLAFLIIAGAMFKARAEKA